MGPFIAGFLSQYNISAPFFASGLVMVVAVIPLAWLDLTARPALASAESV